MACVRCRSKRGVRPALSLARSHARVSADLVRVDERRTPRRSTTPAARRWPTALLDVFRRHTRAGHRATAARSEYLEGHRGGVTGVERSGRGIPEPVQISLASFRRHRYALVAPSRSRAKYSGSPGGSDIASTDASSCTPNASAIGSRPCGPAADAGGGGSRRGSATVCQRAGRSPESHPVTE